jgi:membrane protein DedA with SNARE-associated domain
VDILNALILQAVDSPWLLAVMFAAAVIDGFFPPIPSETVLVAAAAAAASTGAYPAALLLCVVAAAGAWVGDNIAYAIGRGVGTARFRWMRRPRVAAGFARAQRALEQRGTPLILGARYIPVGRVAVNMSAGALGYPWRRFLPVSAVAAVSWAALSTGLGLLAGQWVKDQPILGAVIGIVGALTIGFIVDRVAAGRRARAARAPHPVVLAGN